LTYAEFMNFSQFLLILRARWLLTASIFAVAVLASLAISLLTARQYTAEASVVIDAKTDPVAGTTYQDGLPAGYLATQVDVVGSERVAQRVVKLLKLDESPEFQQQWRESTGGRGDMTAWLASDLLGHVRIAPSRDSSVIAISVKWPVAKMAADIANAFAEAYIDTTIELKIEPAKQYAGWFDQRSRDLRADLEAKQRRLSDFESQNQITAADEHLDIETTRLEELSSQLTAIQAQRKESESRQRQIQGNNETLPEVLQSPVIASLKAELAQAEAKLKDIATRLGENHPTYQTAAADVASLRDRVAQETAKIAASMGTTTHGNLQRENDARDALEAQKQRVLALKRQRDQLDLLRGDVTTAQHSLDAVTQRFAQSSLESQVQQTNALLLTAANEPLDPSGPNYRLNLVLGIFLGVVLGVGAALLLEFARPRVRGEEDLVLLLSVPLLGRIKSSTAWIKHDHSSAPALTQPEPSST
jgi:protein tyrosine kinase modulator